MYIDTKHLLLEKVKQIYSTYELVIEVWHLFLVIRRRGNGRCVYLVCNGLCKKRLLF